jgi:DNA-binding response OmpR family regulator
MKKILVVEDDDVVRKNLSTFLARAGYETEQAGDGIEALEKLDAASYDLLLSDIVMPRMDGLALIERVCSAWPKTRIIAMTAFFQSDSDGRFSAAGAHDFIGKPIMFDDLLAKIERLLASNCRA